MDETTIHTLYGIPIRIAPTYKKRVKTHRIKLIDWIFKLIYGYKDESYLPKGMDVVMADGVLYVRDVDILNKIKEEIENGEDGMRCNGS